MADMNHAMLDKIDTLELSDANKAWRTAMKAASWRLHADREKWTVQSWKETEGEDLQIRRAKLLAKILDNVEIRILDFDQIVGRLTPTVIGCATAMDISGDYIPAIWNDDNDVDVTMDANVKLDQESLLILREAARTFGGKTAPDMSYKAWNAVVGSWGRDAENAKLKDPTLDAAVFGQVTTAFNWKKIVTVGLRSYIDEAQAHIEDFIATKNTDINRLYFWQSAIIVLEAVIRHSRRYAALARDMAAAETREKRREELLEIARVCDTVPENAPRTFHEALQCMAICGVAKVFEHPIHGNPHWGRADQYLYPFFKQNVESGVISPRAGGRIAGRPDRPLGNAMLRVTGQPEAVASDQLLHQQHHDRRRRRAGERCLQRAELSDSPYGQAAPDLFPHRRAQVE